MSDNSDQNTLWPLPSFYFKVTWGTAVIKFSEVSGLTDEKAVIEYRHGDSPVFYPIKMPGMGKVGNVQMKRGVFVNDEKFIEWYNEIKMNTIEKGRRSVTIELLDQAAATTMKWELHNAWPTKITSPNLKSTGGTEAAIDQIDLVFETMTITNKK